MVPSKICFATVLLSLHAANSYILLTANLEDVHSLAKQIAASPVASQLNKIIRRASAIFNQQYNKGTKLHMRSDPTLDEDDEPEQPEMRASPTASKDENYEVWKPDAEVMAAELNAKNRDSSASEVSGETNDIKSVRVERRHQFGPDLVELGKNASFYLKSIKKIFENV